MVQITANRLMPKPNDNAKAIPDIASIGLIAFHENVADISPDRYVNTDNARMITNNAISMVVIL